MDICPLKSDPYATRDQKTEANSLISDFPPDPPPIDRFTKTLAKVCGVLLILMGSTFIWQHFRTKNVAPVVEATTPVKVDAPSGKYGFPTISELKKSVEPAPKPQLKVASKPKAKIASKKPMKKSKKRQRMISSR